MSHPATLCRLLALLVLAGMVSLLALSPGQADTSKGKKYALLVGVREYGSGVLGDLAFTENDVEELAKILNKAGYGSVRLLTTTRGKKNRADAPTTANIRKALDDLLAERERSDTVLIAFSGHGVQLEVNDPDGVGKSKTYAYFCPSDADLLGVSYSTGASKRLIQLNGVFRKLGLSRAGTKLMLMDACRNELKAEGATRELQLANLSAPRGVGILLSCDSDQKSYEHPKLKHGVFFHYVLQGLRGEARNKRGEVTWSGLAEYVSEKVTEEVPELIKLGARQTPHALATPPGKSPTLLTLSEEGITNSIGMKLVLIPRGKFKMGSTAKEREDVLALLKEKEMPAWLKAEGPQREVEMTKPFYLGVYEVTQAEYEKVMGKNPSYFSAKGEGKDKVKGVDTSRFPVETVSWDDAQEFCKNLSARAEEKEIGRKYRLPTEAEWEYACRGGTSTPFHFGNSLSSSQANFDGNYPYGGAAKGPYLGRPCKVGSYTKNAFGLFDMHCNVWEWCQDWYDENYYRSGDNKDPRGPKGKKELRVHRGGGWNLVAWNCRAAFRNANVPGIRGNGLGFRVVCIAPGTP